MPKIEITDPDNVTIDGHFAGDLGRAFAGLASTPGGHVDIAKALRAWHQSNEDRHQGDRKALAEKHAAEIAQLKQQHADATQQAEADRAQALEQVRADADATRKAHEEWQSAQEAEKARRQADHEAALQELAREHARTVDSLQVDLEIARAAHAELREAVAELGDTPQIRAMAIQARRERLEAELAALPEAEPSMAARRAMAAPGTISSLYRATDGRLAKVIRQLPGVVIYWSIDNVATADDPIDKKMERTTVKRWQEAGFTPYEGGQP
jgi:hypothetical protein